MKNKKAKGIIVMGRHHHDFDKKKIVKRPEEEWVRIEATELAYVSAERFDRVNAHLKSKTNATTGRGRKVGHDPLSGKCFCSKCGSVMWRHQSNGYNNWYCSQKYAKGDIVCEGSKTTTVQVRKAITELTNDLEVNRQAVKESILEWLEELKATLQDDRKVKKATQDLQKAQKQKEKLLEVYLEGLIDKEAYRAKYEALDGIIKTSEELLQPVEENEDVKDIENVIANIDKEIDAYIASAGFEDSKIDFLIEHTQKITVNGKHLIIELDLLAGAIIAGKDFMLFVHESMHYRVQITEYVVELKVV